MTSVGVLGPLEVYGPDGPVTVGSGRQRRLLTALAAHPGEPLTVDRIADLVWSGTPPVDPVGAVQTLVARVRRLLPAGVAVETVPGGYALRAARDAVDATAFTDGVAAASAQPSARDRAAGLVAALALWRGRPFADLDHPDAPALAARLAAVHADARERLAAALLDAGRAADAVVVAEGLCVDEPWREGAVAVLMRALAAAGRRRDALAAFAGLRRRMAAELGVDPGPQLRELEARLLRDEEPGPVAGGAPRPPVSSFVGRTADLARVRELLAGNRVLTLVGPGGVGKTRLARHVVAVVAAGYDDGVALVEFGEGGRADVEPAVAAALSLADGGRSGEGLTRRIVEVLAVRRMLLVLDNCEHVADEVARLVEAVCAGGAGTDLLLTSREAVRVDGEQVVPVGPLAPADAATLLTDRIRAAGPDAVPGPADAALVEVVCARLDGLPLALELAAARVAALGLPAIAEALEDPTAPASTACDGTARDGTARDGTAPDSAALDLLRGGRRTAARRHRSLRDVVAWSFGLLDDAQQALFVRMSVFAGPVEAAAVAVVCGDAGALPDLVDRSLVVRHPGEPARFGQLETLRAFGRERLATDRSAEALRTAHATWAAGLAEEIREARRGPGEQAAVARFDAHLPDLRRAHARLCDVGPVPEVVRLGLLFAELGYVRGRVDLVRPALRSLRVVGVLDDADLPAEVAVPVRPEAARLLGLVAASCWQRGDLDLCEAYARRSIALAEAGPDRGAARDGHEALANVHLFRGDLAAARREGRRSVELADAVGDVDTALLGRMDLTVAAAYAGDDVAAAREEEAMAGLVARIGSATARATLAYVRGERRAERDPAAAAGHLRDAVALAESVDSRFVAGIARHTLVTSAVRGGDDVAALLPLLDHWLAAGAWTHLWVAVRSLVVARSRAGDHRTAGLLLGALAASPRATRAFGPDARREAEAEAAGRAALGDGFDLALAEGAALGDGPAIALARAVARH
ncbi:BTAD domain-containing putative transcriptional regulator [Pseudonocardia sp.]|uniref:BTAD domain-containing putative transcriptional regulator n=1 Tax=Pseudonocardia sp. TaxID=60912 RepID=UPI003D0E66D3